MSRVSKLRRIMTLRPKNSLSTRPLTQRKNIGSVTPQVRCIPKKGNKYHEN